MTALKKAITDLSITIYVNLGIIFFKFLSSPSPSETFVSRMFALLLEEKNLIKEPELC